jgi:hypothetical protein
VVPVADPPLDALGGPMDDQLFIRLLPRAGAARGGAFQDGTRSGVFTLMQVRTGHLLTAQVYYSANHGLGLVTTYRALGSLGLTPKDLDESIIHMTRTSGDLFMARLSLFSERAARKLIKAGYPVPIESGDKLMRLAV